MDDYDDWLIDDSAEMVAVLRSVLADAQRSRDEKLEALTMLANLADDDALDALRWYRSHADTGLELDAHLAVVEAESLRSVPAIDVWSDELVDLIVEEAEHLYDRLDPETPHRVWRQALADTLRDAEVTVNENARALLKYGGQLIEIAPADLIVAGEALVSVWSHEREERRMSGWFEGRTYQPFDFFYSWLRTSNLAWGLLLDVTTPVLTWEVAGNLDRDQFSSKVEHILAIPDA